jgi:hypothetical protein
VQRDLGAPLSGRISASRRLKEDVALVERLARTARPDETLAAYADFWRKAGNDTVS